MIMKLLQLSQEGLRDRQVDQLVTIQDASDDVRLPTAMLVKVR